MAAKKSFKVPPELEAALQPALTALGRLGAKMLAGGIAAGAKDVRVIAKRVAAKVGEIEAKANKVAETKDDE